ncbi:MAG: hypothetical protein ACK5U7_12610 [Bacteroidota bacterium]
MNRLSVPPLAIVTKSPTAPVKNDSLISLVATDLMPFSSRNDADWLSIEQSTEAGNPGAFV